MLYSGIVRVNYIKDGLCLSKSYANCMAGLPHLHQTGDILVPDKCPDVVEDVLRHIRIKLSTRVKMKFIFFT